MPIRRTLLVLVAALALVAIFAPPPGCVVGAGDDVGCARGFQTRESDGARPFRWSDDHAWVTLAGAGWGGPRALAATLAAPRPPGAAQPEVTLAGDGLSVRLSPPPTPRRYLLLLPAPPPGADALTLDIRSATFSPPGDRRDLGVALYAVRALPLSSPRILGLTPALALAGALAGAALLLRRAPAWAALIAPVSMLALLVAGWLLAPGRVAPFLPALAALLLLVAWRLPRLGLGSLPRATWAAALAGALLDALLVADIAPGWLAPLAIAAQAALLVVAVWAAIGRPLALGDLLAVALAVRAIGLAARILTGHAAVDPDTELFYNYGRATIELGVPVVEYPSGALVIWALLALPASREIFALLLPLLNLACDLAAVAAIWALGRPGAGDGHGLPPAPLAAAGALCYAATPLLIPFWHGKYDSLPAALTLGALALLAARRAAWSGVALGVGGAIKWAPWLAAPILGLQLLRARAGGVRPLLAFVAGGLGAILALSLPFALRDWGAFLSPYTTQGARPLIGESVWFLPALALEPQLIGELAAPWSGTRSAYITPALTLAGQLGALLSLGLIALLRPPDLRRSLALAALAPALFLLLNRVFSPQYLLPISASLLAAGALLLRAPRQMMALIVALALMQAANLLVWPFTQRWWVGASAALFGVALPLSGWLAYRAIGWTAMVKSR